jgi:hypothetical protein
VDPQWGIFPIRLWHCFTVEWTACGIQSFFLLQETLL